MGDLGAFAGLIFLRFNAININKEKTMKQEQDVQAIEQFIHRIIPYKKNIVFFGSRANDSADKDSDFDILVIVDEKSIERRKLIRFQAKIKRLSAKLGLDADVIVRDKAHVEEMKNFPGNIIHSAFQTGIPI
jgi:predicted nucleotidyltransferase